MSIVLDCGTASTKIGWSGCHQPDGVLGTASLNDDKQFPVGVRDIQSFEKVVRRALTSGLGVACEGLDASVLLTETPLTEQKQRTEVTEMMFESLRVPGLHCCNSAVLALFASGRTRGLSVECGGGVTSVVPVFEGFALPHAIRRADLGGQDVTARLQQLLRQQGHELPTDVVDDAKERLCYVKQIASGSAAGAGSSGSGGGGGGRGSNVSSVVVDDAGGNQSEYELPDGTTIMLDPECRADAAEVLFASRSGSSGSSGSGSGSSGSEPVAAADDGAGLIQMALASLELCDRDLRDDISSAMVLSGGTSMARGFVQRVCAEMQAAAPQPAVVVVPRHDRPEPGYSGQRRYAAWVGGSMLASLGTYAQIMVSRQEYEEVGASVMQRKHL